MMTERLQKLIATAGLSSRREAEKWILAKRVTVNGIVAQLGDKADLSQDQIMVDGVPLLPPNRRSYVMLHKPPRYVSTLSDEKGRGTVKDLVENFGKRLYPVGRLDFMSEGLLLMTDDGDLTQKLLHPSHQVEKEYLLWLRGDVDAALPILSATMDLDGDIVEGAKIHIIEQNGDMTKASFVIHQGKNRQLRRMCAQVNLDVLRLKRIREGTLSLDPKLKKGQWRELTDQELSCLKKLEAPES
ncbi:MAG: pseudouridine synthase [Eubacteriales bacterium]